MSALDAVPARPAEVVEIVELLYRGVFSAGLLAATAVGGASSLLAALHDAPGRLQDVVIAASTTLAVGALIPLRRACDGRLRRNPWILLAVGAVLAGVAVATGQTLAHLFYLFTLVLGVLGVAAPLHVVIASASAAAAGTAAVQATGGNINPAFALPLILIPSLFWGLVELLARFLVRNTGNAWTAVSALPPKALWVPSGDDGRPARPSLASLPAAAKSGRGRSERSASSRLTARQLEVVLLCAEGLNHLEVADCLGLHPQQVRRHLKAARTRVGAATTPQLVAWLIEQGGLKEAEPRGSG